MRTFSLRLILSTYCSFFPDFLPKPKIFWTHKKALAEHSVRYPRTLDIGLKKAESDVVSDIRIKVFPINDIRHPNLSTSMSYSVSLSVSVPMPVVTSMSMSVSMTLTMSMSIFMFMHHNFEHKHLQFLYIVNQIVCFNIRLVRHRNIVDVDIVPNPV